MTRGEVRVRPRHVRLHVDRSGAARLRLSRSRPARRSRSSAVRDRASRRSGCCSRASTTCTPAASRSTASTYATSRCSRCGAASASCSRTRSCSPTRSRPTSRFGTARRDGRGGRSRRRGRPRRTTFIVRLPYGYDTVVGEQGLTLSGGQRQRVALGARAALGPADPAARRRDVVGRRAHRGGDPRDAAPDRARRARRSSSRTGGRRSSLADRIVVVDKGQVVDTGTHDELWERCASVSHAALGPGRRRRRASMPPRSRSTSGEPQVDGDHAGRRGAASTTTTSRDAQIADRTRPANPAAMRFGGGGGGGAGGWVGGMSGMGGAIAADARAARAGRRAAARRRRPEVDVAVESAPDPHFRFLRFLQALSRVAARRDGARVDRRGVHARGPVARAVTASTTRCRRARPRALFAVAGVFLAVTLFDWVVMWAPDARDGPHVGAAAARVADQGVRPSATARRRLLRAGDGGPDHDPHDDRHRRARRSCCRTAS